MTFRTVERGRLKCGQYWPQDKDSIETYDDFVVVNTGVIQHTEHTVTSLILQNSKVGPGRLLSSFPGNKKSSFATHLLIQAFIPSPRQSLRCSNEHSHVSHSTELKGWSRASSHLLSTNSSHLSVSTLRSGSA